MLGGRLMNTADLLFQTTPTCVAPLWLQACHPVPLYIPSPSLTHSSLHSLPSLLRFAHQQSMASPDFVF